MHWQQSNGQVSMNVRHDLVIVLATAAAAAKSDSITGVH
jgi:hypothetical protein